mgnify:CR=1 FL=1
MRDKENISIHFVIPDVNAFQSGGNIYNKHLIEGLNNLGYTPTILTTNSLIFDKAKMTLWWKRGYLYAKNKNEETNPIEPNEHE